ncbi:unnamed protein product [Penicillium nalgiovense]|nr:unnamed protein product [Penicillium nalgiovense]
MGTCCATALGLSGCSTRETCETVLANRAAYLPNVPVGHDGYNLTLLRSTCSGSYYGP